jgi:hypothetical protein
MTLPRTLSCALLALIALHGPSMAVAADTAAKRLESTPKSGKSVPAAQELPMTALLVNELTREIYILPPESVPAEQPTDGLARFLPATPMTNKGAVSVDKLNALDTPLGERLGLLMGYIGKRLGSTKYSSEYALSVMNFINNSGTLEKGLTQGRPPWPPVTGFALSPLAKQNGIIAVFSFRNGDKTGILSSIDLTRIDSGSIVRSYWSRNLNDPTASDKTSEAVEKIISHFQKSQAAPKPGRRENRLRIAIDRRVSERDLAQIESTIKTLATSPSEIPLIPIAVDRNDIRYQTPIDVGQSDSFLAKLKTALPALNARKISNEAGLVQITPTETPK